MKIMELVVGQGIRLLQPQPVRKRNSNPAGRAKLGHYRANDLAREFGGTFVGENRGEAGVFASLEYAPELAEEEEYLNRSSFVPVEEFASFQGLFHENEGEEDDDIPADTLTDAIDLGAKVIPTIGNNPQFLAIAYHMAREESFFDLYNALPTIARYAVTEFGAEAVISALESEPAQDNVDSLFSLVRAARVELHEQRNGKSNRGVACGILQAIGFTVEEIGKLRATGKIRPAALAVA